MKTGRPPLPDKVRVTLSLDRQTVDAARALGNGSVSRGIRAAFNPQTSSNAAQTVPSTDSPQTP